MFLTVDPQLKEHRDVSTDKEKQEYEPTKEAGRARRVANGDMEMSVQATRSQRRPPDCISMVLWLCL
jgi:hypothetical protein